MALSGGCMCKSVRYLIAGDPKVSIVCYCRQCQQITGTGHSPQFGVLKSTVTLNGTPREHSLTADSGNHVTSTFCANCGSPLYKTSSGVPDMMFFHAATLDDPASYRPDNIVWSESRQPWDHVDPSFGKQL
jgi:hypothetical protein